MKNIRVSKDLIRRADRFAKEHREYGLENGKQVCLFALAETLAPKGHYASIVTRG